MELIAWLVVIGILTKLGTSSWLAFAVGALVVGSLWFWLLLAISAIAVFAFIEHDDGIGATGSLAVFLLLLQLFGDVRAFSYVVSDPVGVLLWGSAYFLLGTLWAIAKWWFHCRAQRELYDEKKASGNKYGLPSKPSAADSKEMIVRWMSFWPWSMVWTLINDPIKKAFRAIYRRIQKMLQGIADSAWDGAE